MTSHPRHRQAVPRHRHTFTVDEDLYIIPGPHTPTVWPHVLLIGIVLAVLVGAIYLLGGYIQLP